MRHAVFAHGDFDLHARVVHVAQHFGNAAHGLAVQGGRLGQFHHDNLPRLGASQRILGQYHVLSVAFVFGCEQPDAVFLQQTTNQGLAAALDDFEHAPFGPALAVVTGNARLDTVTVQHGAHFVGGQIQVGRAVFRHDKTVPISVPLYGADDFV